MNTQLKTRFLPVFIALVFTVIIIYLLPPAFNKFILTPIRVSKLTNPAKAVFLHDFNHDGISEVAKLSFQNNQGFEPFFDIRTIDDFFLDNWLIKKGSWIDGKNAVTFGDYDHNGQDEIYAFTKSNDSIFLYGLEPMGRKSFVVNGKFICKGRYFGGQFDTNIAKSTLCDLNGDGYKEIIFSVLGGYSIQPRAMFAYDIKHDTLYRSPFGMEVTEFFDCKDIDGDSKPEIFGTTSVRGNTKLSEPLSDSIAWVIVYNNKLQYKFKPVPLTYYPGNVYECPFYHRKLLVLAKYQGIYNHCSGLYLFNPDGRVTDSLILKKGRYALLKISTEKYARIFLTRTTPESFSLFTVNKDLKLTQVYKSKNINYFLPQNVDINNDGYPEFVFLSKGDNNNNFTPAVVITDHHFKNPVSFTLNQIFTTWNSSVTTGYNKLNRTHYLSVTCGDFWYLFKYSLNRWFYFKYLLYAGIFIVLYWFFELMFRYQRKSIERKHKQEKQIAFLQLKTIKNQLDPHFTLNTLNTIGILIKKDETEKATLLFDRFSKMTRQILMSGNEIKVSLKEELAFIENYLEIQKFRFDDGFDYRIEVGAGIKTKQVFLPRLLVHTFVENAVKHGLRPLQNRRGLLVITVSKASNGFLISVRDNGIGRKESAKYKKYSTGKGLVIAREMVDLYNRLNNTRIKFAFVDLDEGVEVRVWI